MSYDDASPYVPSHVRCARERCVPNPTHWHIATALLRSAHGSFIFLAFFWPFTLVYQGTPVVAQFVYCIYKTNLQIPGSKGTIFGVLGFISGIDFSLRSTAVKFKSYSADTHTQTNTQGNILVILGGLFRMIGIHLVLQGPYTERIDLWMKCFL